METEVWKAHPDIDKLEVSSFGRVRSVEGHYYKNHPNKDGYMRIAFSVNGKFVNKYVHRLVAQTFIKNQDSLPEVNHKDSNPTNNNVSNLEWCSHSYNIQYRDKCGHTAKSNAPKSPVFAVNLTTLEVSRYQSQSEAGRALGVNQSSIFRVIKGKQKQVGGYCFVNDDGHAVIKFKDDKHILTEDEK